LNNFGSKERRMPTWKPLPSIGRSTSSLFKSREGTIRQNISTSKMLSQQVFDEGILKHIVCPLSKTPLRYDKEAEGLICDELKIVYPIQDGIPILIPQMARFLTKDNPNPK
jgi:uncharacterized protein YbaR (Trm112 family)